MGGSPSSVARSAATSAATPAGTSAATPAARSGPPAAAPPSSQRDGPAWESSSAHAITAACSQRCRRCACRASRPSAPASGSATPPVERASQLSTAVEYSAASAWPRNVVTSAPAWPSRTPGSAPREMRSRSAETSSARTAISAESPMSCHQPRRPARTEFSGAEDCSSARPRAVASTLSAAWNRSASRTMACCTCSGVSGARTMEAP